MGLAGTVPLRAAAADPPTFTRDVAPILFEQCVGCHRGGTVAPFSLRSFEQARPRARAIAREVRARRMPPWKPEPGYGHLRGERRLSAEEIETLVAWAETGAAKGAASELPDPPPVREGFQLGEPDLVFELPEGFSLPASTDKDVFRNFVIDLDPAAGQRVRAVELLPLGETQVHHATILADLSGEARRNDDLDPEPGFAGMTRAAPPGGHFFGWTPGKSASALPEGLSWHVPKDCDLVVQLHLVPDGIERPVRALVGLYLTDEPPRRHSTNVHLSVTDLDIAPGAVSYEARDQYTLPVDVEVLTLYPHMHAVGSSIRVWAETSDGGELPLLWIKDWDWAWQDEYELAEPLVLKAGTRLHMELTYDNSDQNPRNPSRPPQRVRWGPGSRDEMGDVLLKVVPASPAGLRALTQEIALRDAALVREGFRHRIEREPTDVEARVALGTLLSHDGRHDEAIALYDQALQIAPDDWKARYGRGLAASRAGRWNRAEADLETATRARPDHVAAWTNLGVARTRTGDAIGAIAAYSRSLGLQHEQVETLLNRGVAWTGLGRHHDAILDYSAALDLEPDRAEVHSNLASALIGAGRHEEAVERARGAIQLAPDLLAARRNLASALAQLRRFDEALREIGDLLERAPDDFDGYYLRGVCLANAGDHAGAEQALRRALSIRPEDRAALDALRALNADRSGPA